MLIETVAPRLERVLDMIGAIQDDFEKIIIITHEEPVTEKEWRKIST